MCQQGEQIDNHTGIHRIAGYAVDQDAERAMMARNMSEHA
jgi:hypothetical protein